MDKQAVDCAAYLRKNPAYQRIMNKILKKYRGLGRVGGKVNITDATEQECEALRSVFGRYFTSPLEFNITDFETALQATKYHSVTLLPLLEAYFGKPIQTKRDTKEKKAQTIQTVISQVLSVTKSRDCRRWLDTLANNGAGYTLLQQELAKDNSAPALCNVCKSKDWLEAHYGQPVRLAILSAAATSDPHALDANTSAGKLFLYLLAFCEGKDFPKNAEHRDELYYQAGILCDSISSSVTQVGLKLCTGKEEHPAFSSFRSLSESNTLTLMNLVNLTSAFSPSGRMYLVENQMVFSQLCDNAASFHSPLICTSGQLQVAVLRLLDLLDASETTFFYSGDFDGEGMSIADRLLRRYPERMNLWHMTADDYCACRSSKPLEGTRLQILDGFQDSPLAQTAAAIQSHGFAGYQEMLLHELLYDLTKTL